LADDALSAGLILVTDLLLERVPLRVDLPQTLPVVSVAHPSPAFVFARAIFPLREVPILAISHRFRGDRTGRDREDA